MMISHLDIPEFQPWGELIAKFRSDPNGEVDSEVYSDGTTTHIYCQFKPGISLDQHAKEHLTDNWFNEIFQFLFEKDIRLDSIHLKSVKPVAY